MEMMDLGLAGAKLLEGLNGAGAFLSAGKNSPNTMTIGWGSAGRFFSLPVVVVLVRQSRFTYDIIMKEQEFTVSVPAAGELKKQLGICGTASGRDGDKFKLAGLTAAKAINVSAPIVGECPLHFECRVINHQNNALDTLDSAIVDRFYSGGDPHTIFFGEILTCYEK